MSINPNDPTIREKVIEYDYLEERVPFSQEDWNRALRMFNGRIALSPTLERMRASASTPDRSSHGNNR